jgi:hypothetical protein
MRCTRYGNLDIIRPFPHMQEPEDVITSPAEELRDLDRVVDGLLHVSPGRSPPHGGGCVEGFVLAKLSSGPVSGLLNYASHRPS